MFHKKLERQTLKNVMKNIIMRVIKKIKMKEDASYVINEIGEIIEIITKARKIGSIKKKKDKEYTIESNGDIVERDVIEVNLDDYYKMKDKGDIAKAFKEGKIVKIKYDDLPISALQNIEDKYISSQLEGATIEEVKIQTKKDGTREFTIKLNNGKTLKLKEGLLVQGAVIEID
jgi:hypothetical protein